MKLSKEQKAELVWTISIDMYNRVMLQAIKITHGLATTNNLSNLVFKYEDDIQSGEYKTMNEFISAFDEDLSMIPKDQLSV